MSKYVTVEIVSATKQTKGEYLRANGNTATAESDAIQGYTVLRPNGKSEFIAEEAFLKNYLEVKTNEAGETDLTATASQLVGSPKVVVTIPLANGKTITKEVESDDTALTDEVIAEVAEQVEYLLDTAKNGFTATAVEA